MYIIQKRNREIFFLTWHDKYSSTGVKIREKYLQRVFEYIFEKAFRIIFEDEKRI